MNEINSPRLWSRNLANGKLEEITCSTSTLISLLFFGAVNGIWLLSLPSKSTRIASPIFSKAVVILSPVNADVSTKSTPNFDATDLPDYPTHFGGDDAVVGQIDFVANKQYLDILRGEILDLIHPLVNRLEARLIGDTVSHNNTVRR